ncbi:MAG: amidohydrolase family protein [Candidatus Latescibacteria bacterium]|jgi:predicted TIM-barrel fold metal-dependent hydrolase|nr:amidohydrolase family protein [Candidatus Latescibacterota bacterium]MEE3338915.1 amidohydrolase family protein [Candidatus Latescibacterota bacterium]
MIIEWNQHIFHPDTERFPLHERASYRPDLTTRAADPLQQYMEHMEAEGIDRAVLVHPEPYGDDHRLVLDCLDREPEKFLGTTLLYPSDDGAPQRLAELVAKQPRLVSTRFHAHRGKEQYLHDFHEDSVRALWSKAVDLGLIIELHIGPDYAEQVAGVLKDIPDSVVLIDHLAEPHMGNAVEFSHVLDLAHFDNVYMKLSGLGHFAKDEPLYESALPFTRSVVDAFGPERMVWGSGTPAIVDTHLEAFSDADRALVKGGNLARLLGWNGAPRV